MSDTTENRLKLIKEHGYELDFSNTFNQALDNYKKIAVLVGAIILVLIIGFTVMVGGIAGVFLGVGSYTEFLTGIDPTGQSSIFLLLSYLASVIGAGLLAPLTAGILKIAHLAEINEEFNFSTAFDYYKSKFFKELFIALLVITSISGAFGTLINLFRNTYNPGFDDIIISLSAGVISVFINLFTILTIPSIIFGELKAIPAIKSSIMLVGKNWLMIILLLIVGIIFSMLGLIGFCIGIFFTLPFYYSLQYIIYRTALPIDEKSEIDEIGNSEY